MFKTLKPTEDMKRKKEAKKTNSRQNTKMQK